ncbi:hypothetical protein RZS08_32170, partial [Arthrospira platensis SPKY1]|nr:hypothetical protein [Arthrospira platensis SPKY1]
GYAEQLSSPIYSTAIGLLMKGIQDVESGRIRMAPEPEKEQEPVETAEGSEPTGPWYEQLFKKTKEWFEAEPDRDF